MDRIEDDGRIIGNVSKEKVEKMRGKTVMLLMTVCAAAVAMADCSVVTNIVEHISPSGALESATNVSADAASVCAAKKRQRQWSADVKRIHALDEAAIALRVKRKGYVAGEVAKAWCDECKAWCKKQNLVKLAGANEFVDSNGCRHLVAVGVARIEGKNVMRRRMARQRSQSNALKYLALASDAEVDKENTSISESHKHDSFRSSSSTMIMSATLRSYRCVLSQEVEDEGMQYCVDVYVE